MPTCNLVEIVHNIGLQQLRKCNTSLYIVTCDNYVWIFKQSTLYQYYLQGGPFGHSPDRNEFLLRRAHVLRDASKLITIIANYVFKTSFITRFLIWKVRRCLVVPSIMSIIFQGQMVNHISSTMSIFLIHMWPFLHVNLTLLRTYTSMH